jgi:hypothetical protein
MRRISRYCPECGRTLNFDNPVAATANGQFMYRCRCGRTGPAVRLWETRDDDSTLLVNRSRAVRTKKSGR